MSSSSSVSFPFPPFCWECEGVRSMSMWIALVAKQERPQIPFLKFPRLKFCPYCATENYWRDYEVRNL